MAVTHNHYVFNPGTQSGQRLRSGLTQLEQGRALLSAELSTMTTDLLGDGSDPTHFVNVVTRYGFVDGNEAAKAAFEELNSALAKITNDTAQTNTDAALRQLFTRLR